MRQDGSRLPTGMQLTAFDPVFRSSPQEYLKQLREDCPIHFDEQLQRTVVTKAKDIQALLRDPRLSRDPDYVDPDNFLGRILRQSDTFEKSILFLDDPDHRRIRSLVSTAFDYRSINQIRPHILEVANKLLDKVADTEQFDVIEDYASPLPIIIIAEMLGVDPADKEDFFRWSRAADLGFSPSLTEDQKKTLEDANDQLTAYFETAIVERRKHPANDLLSAMIAAADGEQRLSDHEIVINSKLLLLAGNLTTTDLIGNAVKLLLDNPEQRELVRQEPALVKQLVEEVLRFDPPVTSATRIAPTDMEYEGHQLSAGSGIFLFLGSAGHDPDLNENPERFDVTRKKSQHFAFGGGAHFCLGAQLARAEAQVAIPLLFERFPKLELVSEPERKIAPAFSGFHNIQVRNGA